MVLTGRRWVAAALGAALAGGALGQTTAGRTTADGVFTVEQANRGRAAYTGPCDRCHGFKLDGASEDPDMLPAPPVAGPKFLRRWNGRSLAALVEYLRATMPANNPGYLSDAEWVDVVAYMLATSGLPAGSGVLPADRDALAGIVISQQRP